MCYNNIIKKGPEGPFTLRNSLITSVVKRADTHSPLK
jgi:hypothetical protein